MLMSFSALRVSFRLPTDSDILVIDRPDRGIPIAITFSTETMEGNGLDV